MPTPKNKYEREHLRRLQAIQRQIDSIYNEAIKEAAAIGVTIDMPADAEKPFSFADYPRTEKRVKEMLSTLRKQMQIAIVNSIRSEWTLANNKNNELCNVVFGKNVGKLSQEQYRRYYSTNEKAREAFIERKENGLKLSDRVWHYSDLFKKEIEMGLDLGIRGGIDAPTMARDLKQYLQHPDKLFRRVRDEHGNLQLSKAAAAFHPGRGVYRSSYMNARRLAATECNIAYRTADHERMKKMDFIVGIEIHLSNNHTCKGRDGKPHPFHDICDELQGKYPKDFKFTGWHPHCRCFVTSVMKTDAEIAEDTRRILRGEKVTEASENTVENVPPGFTKWLQDNEERIGRASQLPYFLRDNGVTTEGKYTLEVGKSAVKMKQDTLDKQEGEIREPKVKATKLVEDWLNESQRFPDSKKYAKVYDAIEHWREGQTESKTLLELIENSTYNGELYRGMTLSRTQYINFSGALQKRTDKGQDVTILVNRQRGVTSWGKDEKTVRDWYAFSGNVKDVRVVFKIKGTFRAYDFDKGADENLDKEVALSKFTKLELVNIKTMKDGNGAPYQQIELRPLDKKPKK